MSEPRTPGPLPCGQEVEPLVVHVADGAPLPSGHVEGCAHCQEALAELREVWAAVGALAAEEVRAPTSIDAHVLAAIRRELFVREVSRLFGGLLPRLSRALLVYSGLLPKG